MNFLANLHPLIIHFPIALLTLYVALEIVSQIFNKKFLINFTHVILLVGVISGIGAVLTGNLEFQQLTESGKLTLTHIEIISNHEYYATLTLWYFFAILILKTYFYLKKKNAGLFNYLFIIFALGGFYLIIKTAKIGGRLVYEYGIGTNLFN
ncbi:MAG: hypothetical protein H6613_00525 [Ignavibacteriales bacterium]|nr:hypothetical protein [Ignavibacteriota bacterium]MCB9247123.1 hypothetical protein [Ignavibacteriales bacterium]